tara:strand:- start:149 stop:331 length:183 start_codon:yes stop_codon:yes gene_type:complete
MFNNTEFLAEYNTFNNRIREAQTIEQLQRLENSLENLFSNGIFSPTQYQTLDLKIMDKYI